MREKDTYLQKPDGRAHAVGRRGGDGRGLPRREGKGAAAAAPGVLGRRGRGGMPGRLSTRRPFARGHFKPLALDDERNL